MLDSSVNPARHREPLGTMTFWKLFKAKSCSLTLRGATKEERRSVAKEALQRVGLTPAMDKRPDELSGLVGGVPRVNGVTWRFAFIRRGM